MTAEKIALPRSSIAELCKIIMAYVQVRNEASPKQVADLAAVNQTQVSGNNAFLCQAGIIDGGRKKKCTELGRRLGRSLEHEREDEITSAWRDVVQKTEFLSNLVSTVRLQQTKTEKDFVDHVLFVADAKRHRNSLAGARTVLDILTTAGFVQNIEGKVSLAPTSDPATDASPSPSASEGAPPTENTTPISSAEGKTEPGTESAPPSRRADSGAPCPVININIQLQLPECDDAETYNRLFKSLRENLLSPDIEN